MVDQIKTLNESGFDRILAPRVQNLGKGRQCYGGRSCYLIALPDGGPQGEECCPKTSIRNCTHFTLKFFQASILDTDWIQTVVFFSRRFHVSKPGLRFRVQLTRTLVKKPDPSLTSEKQPGSQSGLGNQFGSGSTLNFIFRNESQEVEVTTFLL